MYGAAVASSGARPTAHVIFPRWTGWSMQRVFARNFPSLALLVVSALVEREGWDVTMVDQNHEEPPAEAPDAALIITWTAFAPQAYLLADWYRARGVPVVLGGVHASMMPAEALRHADAVVAGEAEGVMGDVLRDLRAGTLQPIYHGEWGSMDASPDVQELAPLYERFPRHRYRPTHSQQSTRGCRFNCDFCSVIRINGRGSRHAGIDRTVDELRFRSQMPPRLPGGVVVFLTDDDLASDLDYCAELFEAIGDAKLPVRIVAQASIGLARHPELLRLAERAGLESVFTGFESVDRDALKEANKKNRPSEYKELIGNLHAHGIMAEGGFIFGFDHDRPETFEHTVRFLDEIEVDTAHFGILTPLPGTATFARMYTDGRVVDTNWSHYTGYRTVFQPENLTMEQLDAGLVQAYRSFYGSKLRLRRFRRSFAHLSPGMALFFGALNASWGRQYRAHRQDSYDLEFQADPADLEALLATSSVPAGEAISTAIDLTGHVPQRGAAPEAPILLGTRR